MSATSGQPITGPMLWRGENLTRSTDWIRESGARRGGIAQVTGGRA